MADRPYLFLELTNSICPECYRKVEAKIVLQDDAIWMHKRCPDHGPRRVLISTDPEYYELSRRTVKPGQMPLRFNTPIQYGCPYDCGLCPDHEQHSCLSIVEITDACNLSCPVCYAESGPHRPTHRPLAQVEAMLDAVVANETEPDIVQISGGEPTIHPEFFAILDAARRRPIKHLMVNTNGVRIAQDPAFVAQLASYMPGFEVYLQFDSLRADPLKQLRGADLRSVRQKALDALNRAGISTTLVVTLQKGVNDGEIGEIIDFALQQPSVRGVTFQPIQAAGRLDGFHAPKGRLTLSEVRTSILAQSPLFTGRDIIPVPCHPDCLAMAYALKLDGKVFPLSTFADPTILYQGHANTITYERDSRLREQVIRLFSTSHSPGSGEATLKQLLCCLPQIAAPSGLTYENIFRITIVQFMDAENLDIRSVKKSCIHIVHPDGRIIPFDTFNLFYRDDRELRLKALKSRMEPLYG